MNKKRILLIILICSVVTLIIYCINRDQQEKKIIAFVEENKSDLLRIASRQLEGDFSVSTYKNIKIDGVFKNSESESIVQFFYSGAGIAPAGIYYGFYYSPTDTPAAFQNFDISLKRENGKWSWSEENTDNGGITKRISEGWYYYEAWF